MAIRDDVRLLIPDVGAGDEQIFSDAQVDSLIALAEDDVFKAAALALEIVATNDVLTYKYIKTDDLVVDGTKGADIILKRAQQLRELSESSVNDAFQIIYAKGTVVRPEAAPWPVDQWLWV